MSPSSFDLNAVPDGWTQLPFSPPDVRSGAATAWTGRELLTWGGYVYTGYSDEEPVSDGFTFDPETGATRALPPSPLAARTHPAFAWTGDELIVWGGLDQSRGFFGDGAAYDPEAETWRKLPTAPISDRSPLSVWTGKELIVWGTQIRVNRPRPRDGAAYDPKTDRWRPIPDAPIELTDATAAWTGTEMIVFGAALHGGNFPETPTAIGAAFDPSDDEWRVLPDSPLNPNANHAVWNGEELIAFDYSSNAASYDPLEDAWRPLANLPIDDCEDTPTGIAVGSVVLSRFCGEFAVNRRGETPWHNVTRPEFIMSTSGWFVAKGIVVVYSYGELFGPNEPPQMFAYRTPRSFACGGFGPIEGEVHARALAGRFDLLRTDRPEGDVRSELDALLSRRGEAAFNEPTNRPLFGNQYLMEVLAVRPLEGERGYRAIVRMGLFAGGEYGEQLILRQGTDLAGNRCELVVDGVVPIQLETKFVPEYTHADQHASTAITFPDGSKAAISFPVTLRFLFRGVQPQVSYAWIDRPTTTYSIEFIHGPLEAVVNQIEGDSLGGFPTPDGSVAELFRESEGGRSLLVYHLDNWTVLVSLRNESDAASTVASLGIEQDELGFPVVTVSGPLRLADRSGGGGGPELVMIDAQDTDGVATLSPGPCTPGPAVVEGDSGSACLADGTVFLSIHGSARYVRDVLDGLLVEPLDPAAASS